ncbi:MAG: hypothetical protein ACYS5V_16235 [Planctomycetota bacterium]|jgi:hypothetical protein
MFFMAGCSPETMDVQRQGDRVWIERVPQVESRRGDPFGRSIALALSCAGHPADYETVMGDSGMAFVMLASEVSPLIGPNGKKVGDAPKDLGKVVGRRDVGWWPLATECAPAYVEFVGRAAGRRMRVLSGTDDPRQEGMAARQEKLRAVVAASIDRSRPAVVSGPCPCGGCFWSVAVGYDPGKPRLWSACPLGWSDGQAKRMRTYPWAAIILGDRIKPMDRRLADRQALRHAVALVRDEVKMPSDFLTGQRAYVLWASELRQMDPPGQARWHANVVGNLSVRRRAAVRYLETMSRRHEGLTRAHLLGAVERYKRALDVLKTADTSRTAMSAADGREALARLAERLAAIESQAASQLRRAAATIR